MRIASDMYIAQECVVWVMALAVVVVVHVHVWWRGERTGKGVRTFLA